MCPEFSSLYTFICLVFASLDKQGLIIIIGILQRRKKKETKSSKLLSQGYPRVYDKRAHILLGPTS